MRVALFPKNCTEELAAALAVAGVDPLPVDGLEGIPAETSGEWSVLVVELADEPMRRLRHIEAIVEGGNFTYFLNGVKVNGGRDGAFKAGKLLFQSEGAEIFFRRIELQPLR